ncbi:MAG: hypothetical protein NTV68_11180 [Methanomicrobiales archaeon]|nr:hypothetical protein [Methanomicrobiales archaeon]
MCEDNDVGVPAEKKKKIFDRGFGKNTGLGLALSREILDITGITLHENWESGKEARFEMTVPKRMWQTRGSIPSTRFRSVSILMCNQCIKEDLYVLIKQRLHNPA